MRVLLDTSVFLRLSFEPERVPRRVRAAVDAADERYLSAVSVWEIAVKTSLGKLELPEAVGTYVETRAKQMRLSPLPVTSDHAAAVESLPRLHRDPFDRLLIAQSKVEGLTFLTTDRTLSRYFVSMLRLARQRGQTKRRPERAYA